jgi:hypothetical protein
MYPPPPLSLSSISPDQPVLFSRPFACGLSLSPPSTTVFSHAQTVVLCGSCSVMLCQPTGGKARLTEGCSFRKKQD